MTAASFLLSRIFAVRLELQKLSRSTAKVCTEGLGNAHFLAVGNNISFITLVLSSPGHAVCGPGNESCEPSVGEARAKIERILNSAWLTPYSIVSLEKLDGRGLRRRVEKYMKCGFFYIELFRRQAALPKIFVPSCITIRWKSTRPQRKQQSRVGYFLNKRSETGARAALSRSNWDG